MADTFESLYREVHLYNPKVPIELCENWVRNGFRAILRKKLWSWAVEEKALSFPAEYTTGTITVTKDSTAVVGSGTVWTSAHENLALKVNNHVFTVDTVTDSTNLILDEAYPKATEAGATYSIFKAYLEAPSDFQGWISVVDPNDGRKMLLNQDQHWLNKLDPKRTSSGSPIYLVPRSWGNSVPRYEVWPHVIADYSLTATYWKISADISASQALPYTVPGDILVTYALGQMAQWPGTNENPNPMFNVKVANDKKGEFEIAIQELLVQDNEIAALDIWDEEFTGTPLDADYLQFRVTPDV